jgi:hypothetical protein
MTISTYFYNAIIKNDYVKKCTYRTSEIEIKFQDGSLSRIRKTAKDGKKSLFYIFATFLKREGEIHRRNKKVRK